MAPKCLQCLQADGAPCRYTGSIVLMLREKVLSWNTHHLLCGRGGIGLRCAGRAQGVLDHACQA